MRERCKVCGGILNGLYDCIECGQCALCWPFECSCAYEELEEEEEETEDEIAEREAAYRWFEAYWFED